MRVCFFGSYTNDPVISVLRKKIELQGAEVIECHEPVDIRLDNINFFSVIKSFWRLFQKHRKVKYDILILPLWWGAIQLPMLKIISRKPIMYFGQGSPYDELVNDRKKIKSDSITARLFFLFEKMVCRWSDLITKESQAEIDYYTKEIGVGAEKFRVLLLSADESKFPVCEIKKPEKIFQVLYFGTFIPLHGVDVIIECAKILSQHNDIVFRFCGEGQTKNAMEQLSSKYQLKNTEFLGFLSHDRLLDEIKKSDICLGIFGESKKTSIVVTNKVYQILCSQKPLITMETDVIKEIKLEDNKNCVLIPNRSPEILANKILELKNDYEKLKTIAVEGNKLYFEKFSMEVTSIELKKYLDELLDK